jgi:hypothetical protein
VERKEIDDLRDVDVDERMKLKWRVGQCELDSSGSRWVPVASSCGHGYELPVYTKGGECCHCLSDCYLLKDCAVWSSSLVSFVVLHEELQDLFNFGSY